MLVRNTFCPLKSQKVGKKGMALSFRRFSWLWFKDRDKHQIPDNSSVNPQWALPLRGEPETLRLLSPKRGSQVPSSSSTKRKWSSNERIDKEYNLVLVQSDGLGYESDDSDWSIGWLEPHAPDFTTSDDEDYEDKADDSFAVLVPCYRHSGSREMEDNVQRLPRVGFLSAVKNLPSDDSSGAKYHIERWLTSHY